MSDSTLTSNAKDWRCFYCDEVFTTEVDARNHFGSLEGSETACRIKAPGEFALLQALRNAEEVLARYRAEDSDALRAMWSMTADHQTALRREEEKGYARALKDTNYQAPAHETGCVKHAVEHRVRDTLPCPWCVIDELKRNRDAAGAEWEMAKDAMTGTTPKANEGRS